MRKLLKTVPVRILRCRAPALNEKSRPETGRHNKRKNAKTDKWLLSKYQNVSVAMSPNPIWSANEALLRAVVEKKKSIDKDTVLTAAADAFEQT